MQQLNSFVGKVCWILILSKVILSFCSSYTLRSLIPFIMYNTEAIHYLEKEIVPKPFKVGTSVEYRKSVAIGLFYKVSINKLAVRVYNCFRQHSYILTSLAAVIFLIVVV